MVGNVIMVWMMSDMEKTMNSFPEARPLDTPLLLSSYSEIYICMCVYIYIYIYYITSAVSAGAKGPLLCSELGQGETLRLFFGSEAGRLPIPATIKPARTGADELPSEAYGMDTQK